MKSLTSLSCLAALAALLVCSVSCSILCKKKASLQDTEWKAQHDEFVADVGTANLVFTLAFPSAKDFTLTEEFIMPAHPATYVNPDGTIDRIPGSRSESVSSGTYRYDGKTLTLTQSDGATTVFKREGDTFVGNSFYGLPLVFTKMD